MRERRIPELRGIHGDEFWNYDEVGALSRDFPSNVSCDSVSPGFMTGTKATQASFPASRCSRVIISASGLNRYSVSCFSGKYQPRDLANS